MRMPAGNKPGNSSPTVLYTQATPTPKAISENMLRLRFSTDCQPRTKNGQPPHSTTGVDNANSNQCSGRGAMSPFTRSGKNSAPIARTNTGSASAVLIQKRRVMSISSAFSSSAPVAVMGSSAMPHLGQEPGSSRTISGCIGQVYCVAAAVRGTSGSSAMPHLGQLPGPGWRTSGCIGQV